MLVGGEGHLRRVELEYVHLRVCARGDVPSQKDITDLPDFTSDRGHLLLKGVYRDYPHHNDGTHLCGRFLDNSVWQHYWKKLAAQSSSWYATHTGAVGRQFTAILATEW